MSTRTAARHTIALAAFAALSIALPLEARALVSARVIWTATTGSGTPGGPTIAAAPGDVLTAEYRLTAGADGIFAYGISLDFDTDFEDELDLLATTEDLPAGFLIHLSEGTWNQESTFSQQGEAHSYDAAALFVSGVTNETFRVGTATFRVNQPSHRGPDVISGLLDPTDGICNGAFVCEGLTASFQDAAVVPHTNDDLRAVFVHTATADNIALWTTELDHPATNGRPDAVILVEQNWDPGLRPGTYNDHHVGVFYDASSQRWSIVNLDFAAMTNGAAFNVLVAKPGGRAFVHEADAGSTSSDTTLIDHPLTNGNFFARILVTPNVNGFGTSSKYNDHPLGLFYNPIEHQWGIFNEGGGTMPIGADFNVLILDAANSWVHSTYPGNTSSNVTTISHPKLDGNPDAILHVTNNLTPWGIWGGGSAHTRGVYYHNGQWRIFNQDLAAMDTDTAFNVFIPPQVSDSTVHSSGFGNVTLNLSRMDSPLTNDKLSPILLTTLRSGTNDHSVGVFIDGAAHRWALYDEDLASFPPGLTYGVHAPALDLRTFIHRTSDDNTTSNWTRLGHPWTETNPNALVFVNHTWNPDLQDGVYHDRTLGVYWTGSDWAIFNQDRSAMPAGVSFNVHVADPSGPHPAFVHTATAGNTSGDTTTLDHPSLNGENSALPIVTQSWNPGGSPGKYNDHEIGTRYDPASGRWQIVNQDGAGILGASFHVLPEPDGSTLLVFGASAIGLLSRRRSARQR